MKSIAAAVQSKASQGLEQKEQKEVFAPNFRILVVDDEKEILTSYKDILCPESAESNVVTLRSSRSKSVPKPTVTPVVNFEVTLASSFAEGLDQVKNAQKDGRPFSLGFFDVMLGEGPDGYQLVKQIHELDSKMYAVFVTAYNDRSIDSIQEFLGSDKTERWDYLNKPFSHGEILQKARNFTRLYNLSEEKRIRDAQLEEARRQLLHNEKMSSVAAVARGVSHEFGNLLMQIMGKADICLLSEDKEKMRGGLEVILDATTRANEILEKFKDLSNPEEAMAEKQPILLSEVVDEALSLMEHKIKTCELKVTRVKSEHVWVMGNKTSLLQVIVNLVINAVYAMGDSGQIDFTITEEGGEAELRIRDYGPGIKEEDLARVLEPFFTTKGTQGTGLGLPICKEIIEIEHLGHFQIQNHGVKGLEVTMRIPKKSEEPR